MQKVHGKVKAKEGHSGVEDERRRHRQPRVGHSTATTLTRAQETNDVSKYHP